VQQVWKAQQILMQKAHDHWLEAKLIAKFELAALAVRALVVL
jgi:hypothetical protein